MGLQEHMHTFLEQWTLTPLLTDYADTVINHVRAAWISFVLLSFLSTLSQGVKDCHFGQQCCICPCLDSKVIPNIAQQPCAKKSTRTTRTRTMARKFHAACSRIHLRHQGENALESG